MSDEVRDANGSKPRGPRWWLLNLILAAGVVAYFALWFVPHKSQ